MCRYTDILLAVFIVMVLLMVGGVTWLNLCSEPKEQDWQAQTEHRLNSMQIQIDSVKTTISVMTE